MQKKKHPVGGSKGGVAVGHLHLILSGVLSRGHSVVSKQGATASPTPLPQLRHFTVSTQQPGHSVRECECVCECVYTYVHFDPAGIGSSPPLGP